MQRFEEVKNWQKVLFIILMASTVILEYSHKITDGSERMVCWFLFDPDRCISITYWIYFNAEIARKIILALIIYWLTLRYLFINDIALIFLLFYVSDIFTFNGWYNQYDKTWDICILMGALFFVFLLNKSIIEKITREVDDIFHNK